MQRMSPMSREGQPSDRCDSAQELSASRERYARYARSMRYERYMWHRSSLPAAALSTWRTPLRALRALHVAQELSASRGFVHVAHAVLRVSPKLPFCFAVFSAAGAMMELSADGPEDFGELRCHYVR